MNVEWKVSSRECNDHAVLTNDYKLFDYRVYTNIIVKAMGRDYEFWHWFVSVGSADSMKIGNDDHIGGLGFIDMEIVFRKVLHLYDKALWLEIIEEARDQASALAHRSLESGIVWRETGETMQYKTFIRGKTKCRKIAGLEEWCLKW